MNESNGGFSPIAFDFEMELIDKTEAEEVVEQRAASQSATRKADTRERKGRFGAPKRAQA